MLNQVIVDRRMRVAQASRIRSLIVGKQKWPLIFEQADQWRICYR